LKRAANAGTEHNAGQVITKKGSSLHYSWVGGIYRRCGVGSCVDRPPGHSRSYGSRGIGANGRAIAGEKPSSGVHRSLSLPTVLFNLVYPS